MQREEERQMNSPNNTTVALPSPGTHTLRPAITRCLKRLNLGQWAEMEQLTVDKKTERLLTQLCVDIINIISMYIIEVGRHLEEEAPAQTSSSSEGGSQKSTRVSESQVKECLGDIIPLTFAEALGVCGLTCCSFSTKVNTLVVKEVTEQVNSKLSEDGSSRNGDEELPPKKSSRIKTLVQHVIKMLQKFAAMMACQPRQESGCETPAPSSDGEASERAGSAGSFVEKTTNAVAHILETQSSALVPDRSEQMLEEETSQMLSISSKEASDAAFDIMKIIMKELGLEEDGRPTSGSPALGESTSTSCWEKVAKKIKHFLANRFAKDSILSIVAKLRRIFRCHRKQLDISSLHTLSDEVKSILADVIPPEKDVDADEWDREETCLYERVAEKISSDNINPISIELSVAVLNHLKPGGGENLLRRIGAEVNRFLMRMVIWLKQQMALCKRKADPASLAVKEIQSVVILEETPVPSGPDYVSITFSDKSDYEVDEAQSSSEEAVDVALAPATEDLDIAQAPAGEVEDPQAPAGEVQDAQAPAGEVEDTQAPAGEVQDAQAPAGEVEDPQAPAGEVEDAQAPAGEVDEAQAPAREELDVAQAPASEVEEAQASAGEVDEASGEDAAHPVGVLTKLQVYFLAAALVSQIFKKSQGHQLTIEHSKRMTNILKEMLWSEVSSQHTSMKLTGRHMKNLVQDVHKDLCKEMGGKMAVQVNLLSLDMSVYSYIIEAVQRRLETPQKSCMNRFFRSALKTVAKPFTACYRLVCKK